MIFRRKGSDYLGKVFARRLQQDELSEAKIRWKHDFFHSPANLVTIAPCFESSFDPRARVVVTTISMAIGIDATIRTTVKDIEVLTSVPDTNK